MDLTLRSLSKLLLLVGCFIFSCSSSEIGHIKTTISDRMENTMHIVEESPVNSAALAGTVVTLTESITNLLSGDTKYDWQKIIKSNFGDLILNYEPINCWNLLAL